MKMKISYRSANRQDKISALCWYDETRPIKGVVQIVHGMCEYVQRYERLAEYLVDHGFAVCGADHLGHGDSVGANGFGYFADKHGWQCLVKDAHKLTRIMKKQFEGAPYFLLGHSMGSFVSRAYVLHYGDELDGLILSGTAGTNPLLSVATPLVGQAKKHMGELHCSTFVDSLAFGSYNKAFEPARTKHDWLTRDEAVVDAYEADERCTFIFTTGAYYDLVRLLKYVSGRRWARKVPTELPIYLYSGDMDPVGNFGKGVREVYENLSEAGCEDIMLKLYEGGRHEMHNEINYREVYSDVLEWLYKHI